MNIWIFTGNLGKDAEVKHLPNGTAVCEFSVAVTSGYGDKKQTTWVRCALFGNRAEGGLPPLLVKGQQVAVSGEACLREWDKPDGSKGAAMQVRVDNVDLVGGKSGAAPQGSNPAQHASGNSNQPNPTSAPAGGGFDDDIPF